MHYLRVLCPHRILSVLPAQLKSIPPEDVEMGETVTEPVKGSGGHPVPPDSGSTFGKVKFPSTSTFVLVNLRDP